MELKQAAVFLSLLGVVMCMRVQKLDKADKHRNALYFEAHKQSLADSNVDTKPNFMLPNTVCPNSTYTCSNNLTCCVGIDKTVSCCPILMGVCCPDGHHCCPPKTQCDMVKKQCYMNKHKLVTADWSLVDHGFLQKSVLNEV